MEKVAILNDIHGNLYLLEKAIDYINKNNVSKILVCGDFLTDGPDDNLIIEALKKNNAIVILGNREESLLNLEHNNKELTEKFYSFYYTYKNLTKDNLDYLKKLPITKLINIENKTICISHGSPYKSRDSINQNSYEIFDLLIQDYPADVYFFAHTHKSFEKTYKNKLFINTGAINMNLDTPKTSTFGILTINNDITIYEQIILNYDFNEVKNYYVNSNYYKEHPEWTKIILYILKDGIEYNSKFSKMYDYSKSIKNNYYRFSFIYNLPKIVE